MIERGDGARINSFSSKLSPSFGPLSNIGARGEVEEYTRRLKALKDLSSFGRSSNGQERSMLVDVDMQLQSCHPNSNLPFPYVSQSNFSVFDRL